jgi:hypothetical protein
MLGVKRTRVEYNGINKGDGMSNKDLNLNLDSVNMLTLNKGEPGYDEPPNRFLLMNYKWMKKGTTDEFFVDVDGHYYIRFDKQDFDELVDLAHICESEQARAAVVAFTEKMKSREKDGAR